MRRVFIPERVDTGWDVESAASKHGEIVYILNKDDRTSAFDMGNFALQVRSRLDELRFDRAQDRFCVVGPLLPVSVCLAALAAQHSAIELLIYNKHTSEYVRRSLVLRDDGEQTASDT